MNFQAFWCGVAATLIVEAVGLIAARAWMARKLREANCHILDSAKEHLNNQKTPRDGR